MFPTQQERKIEIIGPALDPAGEDRSGCLTQLAKGVLCPPTGDDISVWPWQDGFHYWLTGDVPSCVPWQ